MPTSVSIEAGKRRGRQVLYTNIPCAHCGQILQIRISSESALRRCRACEQHTVVLP